MTTEKRRALTRDITDLASISFGALALVFVVFFTLCAPEFLKDEAPGRHHYQPHVIAER